MTIGMTTWNATGMIQSGLAHCGVRRMGTFARVSAAVVIAGVCALGSPAAAQVTLNNPVGEFTIRPSDSGVVGNAGDVPAVVFTEVVHVENAAWLRVYFTELTLEGGSSVRVTSALDNEVQTLDAAAAAMWENTTAYFNGDILLVELIAAPGTTNNRVRMGKIAFEPMVRPEGNPGECGICGADDRQPSTEPRSGRLMPGGCTASIFCETGVLATAGHCVGGNSVVQFNVPASTPGCSLVNPPVADQFPVQIYDSQNIGVGGDWGVMLSGTNSLGQTIFQRYGVLWRFRFQAQIGAATGIFGYGVDATCTRNQTQQSSPGTLLGASSTALNFDNDVRSGNSGSGLVLNGNLIGVVTHCSGGCPSGGSNIATRGDLPAFLAARNAACPPSSQVTIESSPVAGVTIVVTPADIIGQGSGATNTTRRYNNGTNITLTAPVSNGNGQCFRNWLRNGALFSTNRTINASVSTDVTYRATYALANCCPADFNRDGTLDFFDYLDFVSAFDSNATTADFNRDGTVDFFDYLDFVAAFDAGCP
jgi:V8-like Glu-specific endopeptidase